MATSPRQNSQNIDALVERVDNQGTAIRSIAEVSETAVRDLRAETSRVIADLVGNLKQLDAKIDAQSKLQTEQARPQYAALFGGMISAVGLAVLIIQWQAGLRDRPVDDKLVALERSIENVDKNTVSSVEFAKTNEATLRVSELKTGQREQEISQLQVQINELKAETVPRTETQVFRAGELDRDAKIEENVKELIRRFDTLSPTNDVLKDLAERQRDLDIKIGQLKQSLIPTGTIIAKPDKP